jgi:DnaJ family protein A protein 2
MLAIQNAAGGLFREHFLSFKAFTFTLWLAVGQFKAINDEGMPIHQRPFMKGKLYIHFSVDFPESGSLSEEQRKALEAILPPRPYNGMTEMELDECEETILQDVNMEEEMKRKQQQARQEAYEEEEESGGAGPQVQCAQQ